MVEELCLSIDVPVCGILGLELKYVKGVLHTVCIVPIDYCTVHNSNKKISNCPLHEEMVRFNVEVEFF
jgi:hypothetical protein